MIRIKQIKTDKIPKVTVLMPVYNGEKYLKEAIESILNQSFTNFEFLIINDGSTDGTEEIIKSYQDPRIRLVNNDSNLKLIKTLNKGLDLANGEYIARMDADDISLPKRLKTQTKFMEKHPEIGLSGAWAKVIGKGNKKYIKTYSDFEKIKTNSILKNITIHPSVIIRKELLNKYNLRYNEKYKHSEDYELWTRCLKYFPITNIKKYLILYRIHNENISYQYSETQIRNSGLTRIESLKNIEIAPTEKEREIHLSTYKPPQYEITNFLNEKENWLFKLINQNRKTNYCQEPQFSVVVANYWLNICNINANYDFKIFKIFWKSNLRKKLDWTDIENWKILIRFFFKCLFK